MEASFATKNGLFDFQRTVLAMTALERHNLVLYGFTRSELNATLSWFKRIPVTTLRTAIGVSTSTGGSAGIHVKTRRNRLKSQSPLIFLTPS